MTEATLYRLTDADAVMIEKAPPTETQVTQQRSEDVGETGRKIGLAQSSIVFSRLLPRRHRRLDRHRAGLVCHNMEQRVMRRTREEMSAHLRSEIQPQLTGSAIRYQEQRRAGLRSHGWGWGGELLIWI